MYDFTFPCEKKANGTNFQQLQNVISTWWYEKNLNREQVAVIYRPKGMRSINNLNVNFLINDTNCLSQMCFMISH